MPRGRCRRSRLAGLILAAGLASCAPRVDAVVEDLAQINPNEFRYTTTASMLHPANSPEGERHRLRRLTELLAARGMCPQGFVVASRTPPLRAAGIGSEQYLKSLIYSGRCK